jgi:hypothetical protein
MLHPTLHADTAIVRPEMMGLIFAFKRDIVEVTSGGGNKDYVIHTPDVEAGRFLHRFPLEKVSLHACLANDHDIFLARRSFT